MDRKYVHELAGKQDDPLVEEVLAVLFTDQPVRRQIREDNRRHWQHAIMAPEGTTSRIWLSYAGPITDQTPAEVARRAEASLAVFVPSYAKDITASARRVGLNEIDFDIRITRTTGEETVLGLTFTGGNDA